RPWRCPRAPPKALGRTEAAPAAAAPRDAAAGCRAAPRRYRLLWLAQKAATGRFRPRTAIERPPKNSLPRRPFRPALSRLSFSLRSASVRVSAAAKYRQFSLGE